VPEGCTWVRRVNIKHYGVLRALNEPSFFGYVYVLLLKKGGMKGKWHPMLTAKIEVYHTLITRTTGKLECFNVCK
jgi:hypothetical protein